VKLGSCKLLLFLFPRAFLLSGYVRTPLFAALIMILSSNTAVLARSTAYVKSNDAVTALVRSI
jgi:hypothetical protein